MSFCDGGTNQCICDLVLRNTLTANHCLYGMGLIIPGPIRNANCYAVLHDTKSDQYPPSHQKLWLRVRIVFLWRR